MLERLHLLGLRRQISRAALIAALSACAWANHGQSASAQLRSGGSERPLYYGQMNRDSQISPHNHGTNVSRPTATTSTRRPAMNARTRLASDRARSIMEQDQGGAAAVEPPKAAPEAVAPKPAHPRVEAAPQVIQPEPDPLPYDENMAVMGDGEYYGEHGGGCNCGHCSGDDRYFSELAPGCCSVGLDDGCGGLLGRLLGSLSVRAEVPLFWRRAIGVPPLVTTSPAGTGADVAGRLGLATTQIAFGNTQATNDLEAGVRINLSTWLDPEGYRGVIFRYTNAGDQNFDFNLDSNAQAIIARPFNNITTGTSTADTQLIAFPGQSTGSIHVSTTSSVDGFDIVMKRLGYRDRFTRVDWLVGYQHNRIAESVQVDSRTVVIGNVPPLNGSSIAVLDRLSTTNTFNGAVLGLMSSRQFAYWKFEAMGRMGLGSLQRQIDFAGSTVTTSSTGVVTTDDQGLLVRSTNNRPRKDETFVVAPEFGFNAGYFLTQNIDFTVGYNYLLIGKVAQPGRQFDNTVNLSDPLTGVPRPGFVLDTQKYWVHSLNFGMQWRY